MLRPQTVSYYLGRPAEGRETLARSEYMASGRIRGWGSYTAGYEVRDLGDGRITVTYVHGDWARGMTPEKRTAKARSMLQEYTERLEAAGFVLERDGDLRLIVTGRKKR